MKLFKYTFAILAAVAAVGIASGAYWQIFTLLVCSVIFWTIKNEQ